MAQPYDIDVANAQLSLSPRSFANSVAGKLAEQLQDVVGLEDAASFVAAVGAALGEDINAQYSEHFGNGMLPAEIVAKILVDLKTRIGGDFRVTNVSDDRIELVNSTCPFADQAEGRPALCMMTSNVLGRIAAARTGYAHVSIDEAIATGHSSCRVVVNLKEIEDEDGHEYFA